MSAWIQRWFLKKLIISRLGVAKHEKGRLLFVWAPLYVGGGASCIPEACMWVVPGFKEGRLLYLRGRKGGRKGEVERGRGSRGAGSKPGCLYS